MEPINKILRDSIVDFLPFVMLQPDYDNGSFNRRNILCALEQTSCMCDLYSMLFSLPNKELKELGVKFNCYSENKDQLIMNLGVAMSEKLMKEIVGRYK